MRRSTIWATGMALACCVSLAEAQTSYRLTVLPERPTSHDAIRLILNGFAETCSGPNAMYPAVHGQQVDIGLNFPLFPCNPAIHNQWSLQSVIPPLAAGFYVVHIVDGAGDAAQTIRVVDADEPQALTLLGRFGVSVTWGAPGTTTPAHGYPISDESGYFWFFDAANTEVSVKLIDGTLSQQSLLGLSWQHDQPALRSRSGLPISAAKVLRLTARRAYNNPAGNGISVIDTSAF